MANTKAKKTDVISKQKLDKYREISRQALELAKKNISAGREKQASEIIEMAECYLSDAVHFEKKEDYVNAFACLNYAHGWLDCGARLKVFNVNNSRLFAA